MRNNATKQINISPKCLAILLPLVVLKPPTLYIGSFKMVLLPKLNGFAEICNLFWISNKGDNNNATLNISYVRGRGRGRCAPPWTWSSRWSTCTWCSRGRPRSGWPPSCCGRTRGTARPPRRRWPDRYRIFTIYKREEQIFLTISSKFWAAKDDCLSKFLSFKEYFAVAIFMCLSSGFGI